MDRGRELVDTPWEPPPTPAGSMGTSEPDHPLEGAALVKEVCRLIRLARWQWDARNNAACRRERSRALRLYQTLTAEQKERIPQVLRVWLRYRSEKYFGAPKKGRRRRVSARSSILKTSETTGD